MVFMGFFLLISALLLIFNPTMDCGCFGEAVHLTHLQTFVKNLVLSALCCAWFFPFSALGSPKKRKYVAFSMVVAALAAFTVYSLLYIPLVNFTAYEASARLEASERHVNRALATEDEYEAVFVYEKNGKRRTFGLDNLPDSTWTFISAETRRKEISGKYENGISLPVIDGEGAYHDELAAKGLIMVAAASPEAGDEILRKLEADGRVNTDFLRDVLYYSDYKTLITLNRSNGGATFFAEGFLIRKWAFRALPDEDRLRELGIEDPTEPLLSYGTVGNLTFQAFLLYAFAVMLLL